MFPKFTKYFNNEENPIKSKFIKSVDVGYYCKTIENRPLIGPIKSSKYSKSIDNVYLCCGLSGFGIMSSPQAGYLISQYISGDILPNYSTEFLLNRYDDSNYIKNISNITSGQL